MILPSRVPEVDRPRILDETVARIPSTLAATGPVTPGSVKTTREAVTARCSASSASGRTEPSDRPCVASTASIASRMLRSGSISRLATAARPRAPVALAIRRFARRLARSGSVATIVRVPATRAATANTATRARSRRRDRRSICASRSRRARSSSSSSIALVDAGLQVRALGLPDREVGRRRPRLDLLEPRTRGAGSSDRRPIPATRRPPERDARSCRRSSLASSIHVREPAPCGEQRLVRDLDGRLAGGRLAVEGQQAVATVGLEHLLDRAPVDVEGVELAPSRPAVACPVGPRRA